MEKLKNQNPNPVGEKGGADPLAGIRELMEKGIIEKIRVKKIGKVYDIDIVFGSDINIVDADVYPRGCWAKSSVGVEVKRE